MSGRLALLLAAFAAVAGLWSVAVPVGEAPDEIDHWECLRYVAEHHQLPVYGQGPRQSHQMPLYYLLLAPFTASTPLPEFLGVRNADRVFVTPDPPKMYRNRKGDLARYGPVRRVRLISILFSVLAVWVCYRTGYLAAGRASAGLLAAGLMAFLPQFAFLSGHVSNDPLAILFSAAAVYFMVKILRRGFTWRSAAWSILFAGLAYLTKAHAVLLLAPWAIAVLAPDGAWRERVKRLTLAGLWLLLAAGPAMRNLILLGDPFLLATAAKVHEADYVPKSLLSSYFAGTFPSLLSKSFVGYFGYMNLAGPGWLYGLFALGALVSLAGYARALVRGSLDRKVALVLWVTIALNFLFVVWVNLTFNQPQGRYLFPALSALTVIAAIGLEALPDWRRGFSAALVVALCLINVYLVRRLIVPAYWSIPSLRQNVADLPVGRLAGDFTVAQAFVSPCAGLNRIDVMIGTYKMRNAGTVHLTVSEPGSDAVLARAQVEAAGIRDNSYVSFLLQPLRNSLGRHLQFELSSPDAPRGNGVAIYTSRLQGVASGALFLKKAPAPGAVTFRLFCADDWGDGLPLRWSAETAGPEKEPMGRPGALMPDAHVDRPETQVAAGPLAPGHTFGQTFVAQHDGLAKIEVMVATYKQAIPAGVLLLHLRAGVDATVDIARAAVPASTIGDNTYVALEFHPIPDSGGKTYYFYLETQGLPAGYAMTVWRSDKDGYPDGKFWADGQSQPYDMSFRAYYHAP